MKLPIFVIIFNQTALQLFIIHWQDCWYNLKLTQRANSVQNTLTSVTIFEHCVFIEYISQILTLVMYNLGIVWSMIWLLETNSIKQEEGLMFGLSPIAESSN